MMGFAITYSYHIRYKSTQLCYTAVCADPTVWKKRCQLLMVPKVKKKRKNEIKTQNNEIKTQKGSKHKRENSKYKLRKKKSTRIDRETSGVGEGIGGFAAEYKCLFLVKDYFWPCI